MVKEYKTHCREEDLLMCLLRFSPGRSGNIAVSKSKKTLASTLTGTESNSYTSQGDCWKRKKEQRRMDCCRRKKEQ